MPEPSDDTIDWELTTWEGNRLRQLREFAALTFREKLQCLEDFAEIEALFAARRLRGQDSPPNEIRDGAR